MDLTVKQLQKAAKEYNKVIILDNPVDLESESLEKDLYEAMKFIEDGDEFTKFTDAVFNELKFRHTPKPEVKKEKKSKKAKAVEVGTTVELDVETDKVEKIKSGKKMKKEKESGANPQVDAAKVLLGKSATKPELMELLEGDLFTKKQVKTFKEVTNFLSLKKQMTDALDPDVVAEVKAELKAVPKAPAKPKAKKEVKDNPLVNSIKSALKVKQLKRIAKENDQFNWKVLKALDFDEMQKAMLSGAKPVVKVKMVPNPLIAEIEGFKKAKKLAKWAKENEELGYQKAMKKMDLSDLQEALIASIPAEIEKGSKSSGDKRVVRNHIDQEARRKRISEMVDGGNMTQKEILSVLLQEFPEEGKSHTNANILSESKSTASYKDGQRWERFGVGRLVVEDENKCFTWADAPKVKKEKKAKKDKKNKKGNKKNKK